MLLLVEIQIFGAMNKINEIMLQTAFLLGSRAEAAVYAANHFVSWFKGVFYMSIYFIVLKILLLFGIHLHKNIVYTGIVIIIILNMVFGDDNEKKLFLELYKPRKNKSPKNRINYKQGFFGIFLIIFSVVFLMFVGIYTVQGYTLK